MTPKQEAEFESLAARVYRLRALLGDHTSPPQAIRRKPHQNHATFKHRVAQLRRLEIKQRKLLASIIRDS